MLITTMVPTTISGMKLTDAPLYRIRALEDNMPAPVKTLRTNRGTANRWSLARFFHNNRDVIIIAGKKKPKSKTCIGFVGMLISLTSASASFTRTSGYLG